MRPCHHHHHRSEAARDHRLAPDAQDLDQLSRARVLRCTRDLQSGCEAQQRHSRAAQKVEHIRSRAARRDRRRHRLRLTHVDKTSGCLQRRCCQSRPRGLISADWSLRRRGEIWCQLLARCARQRHIRVVESRPVEHCAAQRHPGHAKASRSR
eukprot:5348752-Pleurochrysis_carterae.AAC.12